MNSLFLKIYSCLFFVHVINAQTVPNCLRKDNEDYFCESPGYPNNYQQGDCICELSVPDGYQIAVTIQDMDLDSSTPDYVDIIGGDEDKIYRFSWFLNPTTKQPTAFLVKKSKVLIKFHADKNSDKRGFKILLRQNGELTTTEEVTTEHIFPTPIANDSIYHIIYLKTHPVDFRQNENDFKDFMINITEKYISEHEIEIIQPITRYNVRIQFAQQCPIQWPNSNQCTEIKYALPIVLNTTKYELSTKNLENMWMEFGQKYLEDHTNWKEYAEPNNDYNMLLWLGLSLIILIAFLLFLFFMKMFSPRLITQFKRRASDTDQIMANSNRNSDASLWPMSSQIVPPLFDNESPYVYYEADPVRNSIINSQIPPSTSKTMMNIDDMSEDEIGAVITAPNRSGDANINQRTVLKFNVVDPNKESAL